MGTVDFSSYFQHVQENKPDCLVGFMPGGPMSVSTVKDFHNRGFAKEGMELMGTVGAEFDLPAKSPQLGYVLLHCLWRSVRRWCLHWHLIPGLSG